MNTRTIIKRLVKQYLWRYRGRLAIAIGCMMTAAACTAANAYMMQPVLDRVFIEKNLTMLWVIPIAVFSIATLNAAASYGQALYLRYVGQRILSDMQIELFSQVMRSDLAMFHDQSSGRLISRFTNDIQMMRHAVTNGLTTLAREVLTMLFLFGVMLYQSVVLTVVALAVFPLAIIPVFKLSRRMRKIADGTQVELAEFTQRLDEIFQGARTVKAYAREDYEAGRARTIIEKLFKLYYKASRVQAASSPMMEVLSGIAIASVIGYGGYQVIHGVTTPGAFFSFIAAFIMAYRPVKALAGINTTLQEGFAAADRFFKVMDAAPEITNAPGAKPLLLTQGTVKFENVGFRYDPEMESVGAAVENITLTLKAGQKVALVGPSGGGKSTLLSLLLRFYDVQSGTISIDGQDIRNLTLKSLREAIAYVPQETMLFDDTVANNIAYGRLDADVKDIHAAARAAQAEEFILRLPQGYETVIGPNGVKLSGGQRQRLAIARAMLKNAPILLLDEATSALDNASERLVQEALTKLMEGRTTLIIAHRLSTVLHADVIHVLARGRIVESGTHAELLAKGGVYARLYNQELAVSAAAV